MLNQSKAYSGFSTNDIGATKDFYANTLGLKVTENPVGFLEIHTSGNNPIVIYPKENHEPASFTILNFPVEDIDRTVDELTNKGVVFEKYDGPITTDEKGIARGGSGRPNAAWFKDPGGNVLGLLEFTN